VETETNGAMVPAAVTGTPRGRLGARGEGAMIPVEARGEGASRTLKGWRVTALKYNLAACVRVNKKY